MKVIAGEFKNKHLIAPKGMSTRPMTNRVKEDLFNIINNFFTFEKKVGLDLFSGSGQLGLEFLSRGGSFCYFNDFSKSSCEVIAKNIENIDSAKLKIFQKDYLCLLKRLMIRNIQIDALFLDPPFKEKNYYYKTINFVINNNILNNYGIIATESNFELSLENLNLEVLKIKKYPNKFLYLLRKED